MSQTSRCARDFMRRLTLRAQPRSKFGNQPDKHVCNNAPNMISFVDGHVSYVKMYCGSNNPSQRFVGPCVFNPPAEYDYKWSAD